MMICSAEAQTVINKTAIAGKPINIDSFYSVNPDCTSIGYTDVRLTSSPQIGTVSLKRGTVFPNFPANNVRNVCNTKRVASTQVWYTAPRGASGRDQLSVLAVFPSGNSRQVDFAITVTP